MSSINIYWQPFKKKKTEEEKKAEEQSAYYDFLRTQNELAQLQDQLFRRAQAEKKAQDLELAKLGLSPIGTEPIPDFQNVLSDLIAIVPKRYSERDLLLNPKLAFEPQPGGFTLPPVEQDIIRNIPLGIRGSMGIPMQETVQLRPPVPFQILEQPLTEIEKVIAREEVKKLYPEKPSTERLSEGGLRLREMYKAWTNTSEGKDKSFGEFLLFKEKGGFK
ncbi:MAG: hypothetical protein ACOZAL_02855, partial [Patescibacteria group bacterium]